MFRMHATLSDRARRRLNTITRGPNAMKTASDDLLSHPRDLSGPAAAVLVALAGAALVAVGLLLVGLHDGASTRVGLWAPPLPSVAVKAQG
jgi:hypothetical protein